MGEYYAFELPFATSHRGEDIRLTFDGDGDELAWPLILAAFHRIGRDEDGMTGFALSPADAFDYEDGVLDSQFLQLEGHETLRDLRRLIGPDDHAVCLRTTGWGGSDLAEMYNWVVSDLLPYGQAFLEIYGAVEFIKVAGRAFEARKDRELRREADYWVRSGNEEVQGFLRDAVMRLHAWPAKELNRAFALAPSDAAKLMRACGYSYDPASECYYRLNSYPGLFT